MNRLVPIIADRAPVLIATAGAQASTRFFEFFVATIRNPNTRRAYVRAVDEFFARRETRGLSSIVEVQPVHAQALMSSC